MSLNVPVPINAPARRAAIAGGSGNPVTLGGVDLSYRVARGYFDVFAVRDSSLASKRRHLFRLDEGSALFGLPAPEAPHVGLIAVGSLDSELEVRDAAAQVPLADCEAWIVGLSAAFAGRRPATPPEVARAGTMAIAQGGSLQPDPRAILWARIASGEARALDLHMGAGFALPLAGELRLEAVQPLEVEVAERPHLRARDLADFHRACQEALWTIEAAAQRPDGPPRADHRDKAFARSLTDLAGAWAAKDAPYRADALQAAVSRLLAALDVVPDPSAFDLDQRSDAPAKERIADLLRRHRVMGRAVLLRDAWQEREGPPLLAYAGQERRPVALLSEGRRWRMFDGEASAPVDAAALEALSPQATQLYPTLPTRKLGFRDLFAFGFSRAGGDYRRVVLLMLGGACLAAFLPFATRFLVDEAMPRGDLGLVGVVLLGLFASALAGAVFDLVKGLTLLGAELRFETRLQPALVARMLNLPAAFFRKYGSGDILDRVMGVQRAREALSSSALAAIFGVVFSLVSLAPVMVIDWRLGLVVLALSLLLGGATAAFGWMRLRHERLRIAQKGKLDSFVLQMLLGVAKLKVSASEPVAFARWAALFRENTAHFRASQRWDNHQQVGQALLPPLATMALYGAILHWMKVDAAAAAAGAPGAAAGPFSGGAFVAVSAGFAQVLGAVTALSEALTQSLSSVPLIQRAEPILSSPLDLPPESAAAPALRGAIDIREVKFRYGDKSPLALDGVNIKIEKGEFVAIVGASGSGKSTLMRLLLGFERPEGGEIFYDGAALRRLDLPSVRRQIGVVLQNGRLSAGTMQSNLVGDSGLGMEAALAAARLVGLEDDIAAMPMGLHTVLLDGGGTLSGGQRQRILIARALVSQPAILLLDEATSALDNRSQAVVTQTLERLSATRVVIAHRLSTIAAVDRIIVMHKGKVAETGGYKELMAKDGHFAALAKRQLF